MSAIFKVAKDAITLSRHHTVYSGFGLLSGRYATCTKECQELTIKDERLQRELLANMTIDLFTKCQKSGQDKTKAIEACREIELALDLMARQIWKRTTLGLQYKRYIDPEVKEVVENLIEKTLKVQESDVRESDRESSSTGIIVTV